MIKWISQFEACAAKPHKEKGAVNRRASSGSSPLAIPRVGPRLQDGNLENRVMDGGAEVVARCQDDRHPKKDVSVTSRQHIKLVYFVRGQPRVSQTFAVVSNTNTMAKTHDVCNPNHGLLSGLDIRTNTGRQNPRPCPRGCSGQSPHRTIPDERFHLSGLVV